MEVLLNFCHKISRRAGAKFSDGESVESILKFCHKISARFPPKICEGKPVEYLLNLGIPVSP